MSTAAAFNRSVEVFVSRALTPTAQSAALATAARQGVNKLIQAGQAAPVYTAYVDGVKDAAFERVKPDGVIMVRFNAFPAVAAYAMAFLEGRSPVKTGRFRNSFYVGVTRDSEASGKYVAPGAFSPAALTADVVELVIGSVQPYSRKIDVQLVGGQKLQFSVPAGLFEDAAQAINTRFAGLVVAKRVYTMQFPGQYRLVNEQYRLSGPRKGQALRRIGKPVESPALVIALPGAFTASKTVSGGSGAVGARSSPRAATGRQAAKPGRETRESRDKGPRRQWNDQMKTFDYMEWNQATGKYERGKRLIDR